MNDLPIVLEYLRRDGTSPFGDWLDALSAPASVKVRTAIARLELGSVSRVKWIGVIGEYRIDWGPGYRIYLARDGATLIILLGGGTKKRQQADIRQAMECWVDYKARKGSARSG